MKTSPAQLTPATRRLVAEVYGRLDYGALAPVYCYEGGNYLGRAVASTSAPGWRSVLL